MSQQYCKKYSRSPHKFLVNRSFEQETSRLHGKPQKFLRHAYFKSLFLRMKNILQGHNVMWPPARNCRCPSQGDRQTCFYLLKVAICASTFYSTDKSVHQLSKIAIQLQLCLQYRVIGSGKILTKYDQIRYSTDIKQYHINFHPIPPSNTSEK